MKWMIPMKNRCLPIALLAFGFTFVGFGQTMSTCVNNDTNGNIVCNLFEEPAYPLQWIDPGNPFFPGTPGYVVLMNSGNPANPADQQNTALWGDVLQFQANQLGGGGSSTLVLFYDPATFPSYGTVAAANVLFMLKTPGGVTVYDPNGDGSWLFYVHSRLQFIPVTPCRIMDTRNASGTFGGPFIPAGGTRAVPVPSGGCNIPATAAAYSLNITVVPRTGTLGYLTVWPTGQTQPVVSTLNSPDGSVLANAAIVPAGTGGSISAFALNDTDLVIDINGYFVPPAASTLQFYPLPPCRVLDTRNANGAFGGPAINANTSRSFAVPASGCGAPGSAAAYSFNVTVVPHGFLGYLTAWPTGQPQPFVSTLNSLDGSILANAAIVPAGAGGAVSFYALNTTDLVVDINGYFAPASAGGLNFLTASPCRLVDTRNATGPLGGPIMSGNTARTFPLPTSSCGLPATVAAYSLNMTVVPSGPLGYLTTWPTGQTQPLVSTLNAPKGLVVANAALVPAGANSSVDVYVLNTTHVVIDVNGYFGR